MPWKQPDVVFLRRSVVYLLGCFFKESDRLVGQYKIAGDATEYVARRLRLQLNPFHKKLHLAHTLPLVSL
jgi:hypothetical protein